MNKKILIALADMIRAENARTDAVRRVFSAEQIEKLADFCESQNPNFNRGLWLDYVHGKSGPSGGKVKK